MSEQQEAYQTAPPQEQPVDPHTALYNQVYGGIQANTMLYEHIMDKVLKLLPGSQPQAIEDALNMMCVSLSKTPLESLLGVHEFLRHYTSIMQHETKSEQVAQPESPFLGRGEE